MRSVFILACLIILTGCSGEKRYNLLYPIEASKQTVLRLEGYRFLSTDAPSPASILVLSNPVENGGFVDLAFALRNDSEKPVHIGPEDIIVKLSKLGELKILSPDEYAQADRYQKPEGFDRLSPKMKAFGCAAEKTHDNIKTTAFDATQAWVWARHLAYPFKKDELYLNQMEVLPEKTQGRIFRIALPKMDEKFEQSTMLIQIRVKEEKTFRFKFILQSLQ